MTQREVLSNIYFYIQNALRLDYPDLAYSIGTPNTELAEGVLIRLAGGTNIVVTNNIVMNVQIIVRLTDRSNALKVMERIFILLKCCAYKVFPGGEFCSEIIPPNTLDIYNLTNIQDVSDTIKGRYISSFIVYPYS